VGRIRKRILSVTRERRQRRGFALRRDADAGLLRTDPHPRQFATAPDYFFAFFAVFFAAFFATSNHLLSMALS
jgi:hypothetical protein